MVYKGGMDAYLAFAYQHTAIASVSETFVVLILLKYEVGGNFNSK